MPSLDRSAEAAVLIEEKKQRLMAALALLPPKERAAVVLREIEGLSTAEVAAALGSSEVTVRSQISKALVRLRGILESRGSMNEEEMRELFREMREEPIPADSLARVTSGVDQRIQKAGAPGGRSPARVAMAGCIVADVLVAEAGEACLDSASEPTRNRAGAAAG